MAVQNPTNETVAIDAQPDDLDERDIKALLTPMTVIDNAGDVRDADGMYEVTSASGSEYIVDIETESCTCPDHEYNKPEGGCKHLRRVRFEIGETAIPSWVNFETVDDQLGMHITEGEPRIAATDGGVAIAEADRQSVTEAADNLAARIGHVIGIDAQGDVHVHYAAADKVRVYNVSSDYEIGDYLDEDNVEHVRSLEGRPLKHWMQFIAEDRGGWAETTHHAPDGFSGEEVL